MEQSVKTSPANKPSPDRARIVSTWRDYLHSGDPRDYQRHVDAHRAFPPIKP